MVREQTPVSPPLPTAAELKLREAGFVLGEGEEWTLDDTEMSYVSVRALVPLGSLAEAPGEGVRIHDATPITVAFVCSQLEEVGAAPILTLKFRSVDEFLGHRRFACPQCGVLFLILKRNGLCAVCAPRRL